MEYSNFIKPLIGGFMIGLAASILLWTHGKVMGISGILGGIFKSEGVVMPWRWAFLAGLIFAGFLLPNLSLTAMTIPIERSLFSALLGGLLVGIGTQLGSGCTSGHGICGISRLSPRSLVATAIFLSFGIVSVLLYNLFQNANL